MRRRREVRGSITVEAALVIPLFVMVLCLCLWLGTAMCTRVLLTLAAQDIADGLGRGSWRQTEGGAVLQKPLYEEFQDTGGAAQLWQTWAGKQLQKQRWPGVRTAGITIEREGIPGFLTFHVTLKTQVRLPGGSVAALFGAGAPWKTEARAVSLQCDPAGWMRMTDGVTDMAAAAEKRFPAVAGKKTALTGWIGKGVTFLKQWFSSDDAPP